VIKRSVVMRTAKQNCVDQRITGVPRLVNSGLLDMRQTLASTSPIQQLTDKLPAELSKLNMVDRRLPMNQVMHYSARLNIQFRGQQTKFLIQLVWRAGSLVEQPIWEKPGRNSTTLSKWSGLWLGSCNPSISISNSGSYRGGPRALMGRDAWTPCQCKFPFQQTFLPMGF